MRHYFDGFVSKIHRLMRIDRVVTVPKHVSATATLSSRGREIGMNIVVPLILQIRAVAKLGSLLSLSRAATVNDGNTNRGS